MMTCGNSRNKEKLTKRLEAIGGCGLNNQPNKRIDVKKTTMVSRSLCEKSRSLLSIDKYFVKRAFCNTVRTVLAMISRNFGNKNDELMNEISLMCKSQCKKLKNFLAPWLNSQIMFESSQIGIEIHSQIIHSNFVVRRNHCTV